MQIFKKHAKLTYLFIWKSMLQSVILLWKCAFWPWMFVFVMVCETRPLPVYPIVFRHAGLPVGRKQSIFHVIHHHVCSFLLVSLIWQPVCAQVWGGGAGEKNPLQYFEFGLQCLVQPLGVNPTYSTFNFDKEYLYGYETLVFATSGILSMHKQLVTLQRESKLEITSYDPFKLYDI